jgi:hypothetical protein
MRYRELGSGARPPELIGDHRLAPLRGFERKVPQCIGMPQRLKKQHVTGDARIIERRAANLAETQSTNKKANLQEVGFLTNAAAAK